MSVEAARAKVNLALHIRGRRADGYHDLDSIVAFADLADRLTITPAADWSLDIEGPFAGALGSGSDNLVLRAARALEQLLPGRIRPARLRLDKNLPVASGIGGGSADAAAAIRGLLAVSGIAQEEIDLAPLALTLGADVPVCLYGKTCRMTGIGERIEPLTEMPALPALLVNPGVAVATAEVFRKLALTPGQAALGPIPQRGGDVLAWLTACRNDLQPVAVMLVPVIGMVLDHLAASSGCRLARMSGSGATCFGLFEDPEAAEAAGQRLRAEGWWAAATMLG
jgi:4-diphosphocytidyl-2-C-methyl-D-erythritol kinase